MNEKKLKEIVCCNYEDCVLMFEMLEDFIAAMYNICSCSNSV